METKTIALGEFVKLLTALLQESGIEMPFENERPWHMLLYDLKKSGRAPKSLNEINRLRFDWDGPYPKSPEVSEILQALHWNASISALNPTYQTIVLPQDIAALWLERYKATSAEARDFIDYARDQARRRFPKREAIAK
jgi:hypothetical protein